MIVSWLRKGPSGIRQLMGLLFGESLLSCDLCSQNREEALRLLLLGGAGGALKLSSLLIVGESSGPGYCPMCSIANYILLLKTKLASN